uniref:MHC class I-like antigen recognition-like domain-containing protein n=1 Tax=Oryzias sinensis TaxID=183150 RepID=A0A8C7X0L0_9TELE
LIVLLWCSGFHILQRMNGCEWDDERDEVKGFEQFGYDGEDFISLDLQTETWIAPKTQAIVIKHLWDADKERIKNIKYKDISMCRKCLQECIHYGRSFLQRTGRTFFSLFSLCRASFCIFSPED